MSSGRDSRRRNRNIGTAWQGHGSNNRLVIPDGVHSTSLFWERLTRYKAVTRAVGGKGVTFIVERTRADSCHSCTVDDIEWVLRHMPASAVALIDLVILRQPKRKEQILDDAWGRAAFFAEVGRYRGPAIIIEAVAPAKPLRWSKSLGPERRDELARLSEDGHTVTATRHHHLVGLTYDSARSTQLYRTLLHEIGHHVDYRGTPGGAWERKSSSEKERFAHDYANDLRAKLIEEGVIPFDRILNPGSLERDGFDMTDFIEPGDLTQLPL